MVIKGVLHQLESRILGAPQLRFFQMYSQDQRVDPVFKSRRHGYICFWQDPVVLVALEVVDPVVFAYLFIQIMTHRKLCTSESGCGVKGLTLLEQPNAEAFANVKNLVDSCYAF